MLERYRSSYREARVRKALLRQSAAWKELGGLRLEASERWQRGDSDAWTQYKVRRSELVSRLPKIVRRTAPLREVARDLYLTDADLIDAYRTVLRHSQRPLAMPLHHTPTALMLLPVWLEAVGALYLSGRLESEVGKLEDALIAMDSTYPLSVLEPLVFSRQLSYAGLGA